MNIKNNVQEKILNKMVVRLWLIMMSLVVFTVVLMWIIQLYVLERNYTSMAIREIQERLEPVMEELATEDLAGNEKLIPYLSRVASGKLLFVDEDRKLVAMYSYGYPVNLEGRTQDIVVWKDIENSDVYQLVLDRETYSREIRAGSRLISYEIGIPAWYDGEAAYVILHQTFSELYGVLGMNRMLLIVLSILLTLVSAVIAAFLSRKFIQPIHIVKETVDELA